MRSNCKKIRCAHQVLKAKDFSGMSVSTVRVSKSVGGSPNVRVNNRRLYDITLRKKR